LPPPPNPTDPAAPVPTGFWRATRRAWGFSVTAYQHNPKKFNLYMRHLRWAAAAAIRQAAAHDWFSLLETPAMRPFVAANPRLAFRPMGTYLSVRWDWSRRIKVIKETYEFIHAHRGGLRRAMLEPGGIELADLDLGKAGHCRVLLRPDAQFRKEGEVGVFLELSSIPGTITALAFSLEYLPETGWSCYLGSVQGRKGGDEPAIKAVTKAMHGFRPKMLMVFLAQEIARSLRMTRLLGTGNGIHTFRGRMGNPLVVARNISFDYDALWTEAGGTAEADGWFQLPLKTHRRGLDEVKPNKRSMYVKRYAMMDELARQIRTMLGPG
jgi:uncharacterized protein VirK/YbjX